MSSALVKQASLTSSHVGRRLRESALWISKEFATVNWCETVSSAADTKRSESVAADRKQSESVAADAERIRGFEASRLRGLFVVLAT